MVICRQMTYLIFGGTENVKKRFQIEMLERFKAIHVSRTKPGSSGMICCIGILQIKANDRWHWHCSMTTPESAFRVCVSVCG